METTAQSTTPSLFSKNRVELFVISLLCLFCELAVIRWLSTEIRIFSYFKNLPLAAALLGLGLGFLWVGHKRNYFNSSASLLIVLSSLLMCSFNLGLTYLSFIDPTQYIIFCVHDSDQLWVTVRNLLVMLAVFILTTGIFVGFGQRMGTLFGEMKPLEAYSINVAGSLGGTLLYTLLSWMATPPSVWLIVAGCLFLYCKRNLMSVCVIVLGIVYGTVLAPILATQTYGNNFLKTCWSPYYRIDVLKVSQPTGPYAGALLGYNININFDTFQSIVDCSPESLKRFPPSVQQAFKDNMADPYKVVTKKGPRVLILGSGTGSDVATALRNGASHVDAVEIDPQIVQIGKDVHPEHPYDSEKVTVFVEDARTFLKNAKDKYDIVIFAALDSHTAFSSLSSLRTDNYIFTKEALQEANRLLLPGGIVYENFVVPMDWLFDRHAATLASATNMLPLGYTGEVVSRNDKQIGGILFAGPGAKDHKAQDFALSLQPRPVSASAGIEITTDDWPFLFLPKQQLPLLYVLPLGLVLLASTLPVAGYIAKGGKKLLNWQMLFLGMGFMLLEVRAMAKISLLLGSTWVVNSIVISAVLVLVLIANYCATKLKTSHILPLGGCLIASLLLSQIIQVSDFLSLGSTAGPILATVIYLLPCLFASTIFALLFSQASISSAALAFNLIGGIYGVALEYLSMSFGINALGFISLIIYGLTVSSFAIPMKNPSPQVDEVIA